MKKAWPQGLGRQTRRPPGALPSLGEIGPLASAVNSACLNAGVSPPLAPLSPDSGPGGVESSQATIEAMDAGEILTVAEVASDLRCSKAHVYKAINGAVNGVVPLPSITFGRRRLVRRSTLEQWKRENEHGPKNRCYDPIIARS